MEWVELQTDEPERAVGTGFASLVSSDTNSKIEGQSQVEEENQRSQRLLEWEEKHQQKLW